MFFIMQKQKAAINEIDIEQRLVSFPVKLLEKRSPDKSNS
jgi:hypothetical protein